MIRTVGGVAAMDNPDALADLRSLKTFKAFNGYRISALEIPILDGGRSSRTWRAEAASMKTPPRTGSTTGEISNQVTR